MSVHDGQRPAEHPDAPATPSHPWPSAQHGVTQAARPGRWASFAAPRQPRTHRWGLPAFLLAEAVFLLISAAVLGTLVDVGPDGKPQLTVATFAAATVLPTVAAAAVALIVTRLRGNGPRIDLGLVWSWRDVGIGLMLGFAGLFLSSIAALVWISIVGPDVNSAVAEALAGLRASWPVALGIMLAVVIVAPVCEEILYRGLLWGAVEKLGAGPWLAFAITTVVFSLAHLEFVRAPLLLVISIPLALARLLTGRLLASMVAHAFNNLLPGVALFLMLTGVELPTSV